MKSVSLKELGKDKRAIEQTMEKLRQQILNQQIQLYRLDGALGYINDNITQIKEVKK